ncbi:MAG: hypothetical protein OEW39_14395, partial [Deltaproteobacteria bacterium]|nr:hypothetical protein [Deltaproteobacteria bacterium]
MKNWLYRALPFVVAWQCLMSGAVWAQSDGAARAQAYFLTLGGALGYDSNVYTAPEPPYRDYYELGYPDVLPKRYPGQFISTSLDGGYDLKFLESHHVATKISYNSRSYSADRLQNANTNYGKVHLGYRKDLGTLKPQPQGEFYLGMFKGRRGENYVDNDTGLTPQVIDSKTLATFDLSNRYAYHSRGGLGEVRYKFDSWVVQITGETETRDYENPVIVSEYDNRTQTLTVDATRVVSPGVELVAHGRSVNTAYSDRHARDRQGTILKANPLLVYKKRQGGAEMAYRPLRNLALYFALNREYTEDSFVHYNDSVRDEGKLRVRWHPKPKWLIRTVIHLWREEYPNAFAFDNPY